MGRTQRKQIAIKENGITLAPDADSLNFSGPAHEGSVIGNDVTEDFSTTGGVVQLTDAATVTPNADTTNLGILLSLSQTTLFATPTGTPEDGHKLEIRITSASPQTISFSSGYTDTTGVPFPTATTGSGKTDWLGFKYNIVSGKWNLLATVMGSS